VKAVAYTEPGGPEVLRYVDVPDPDVAPGGLVIAVRAVGIQGGDVLSRASRPATAGTPHVVGYQASGTVAAVGPGVADWQIGERVVAHAAAGSHAELFAAESSLTWRIPDGLSFEAAAGVPIEFGTAHDALFEFGDLVPGETVLVQAAASGVGLAAVQLAKAAGARVLGSASSDERLARLADYGLDVPINYLRDDVAAAAVAATDGRGVDLVIDPVGGRTLETSIAALAYRGRVTWVGNAGRDPDPPDVISGLMLRNASLRAVYLGAELSGPGSAGNRANAMIERLIAQVAVGEFASVIDSTFPLAEAAAAHRYIESRAAFGRVVLIP
jgi:NADPH2:quinone reductase